MRFFRFLKEKYKGKFSKSRKNENKKIVSELVVPSLQWTTSIYVYIYASRKSIIFEIAQKYIYASRDF